MASVKDEVMEEKYDRCVVVSPRHDFVRSWIRAYFSYGNTIPLVLIQVESGGWTDEDVKYCEAAAKMSGGMVFRPRDCSSKKDVMRHVASEIRPKTWAWIDDDVEVTGNVDECFECAEKSPGFVFAEFYAPDELTDRKPDRLVSIRKGGKKRICRNSFVFFHGNANDMLASVLQRVSDEDDEDDEEAFGRMFTEDNAWRCGFCDFSYRMWQRHCHSAEEVASHWSGKAMHHDSSSGDPGLHLAWAKKSDSLPPAAFEVADSVRPEDVEGPVDAVFVIGNGSVSGDEELRYALRNLERNCGFVRDVYICGHCPEWVDRSKVKHLQWPDRFRHAKDANIIDKLRHACECRGIAKRILFCSDDQFQTRECSWEDFRPRYLREYFPDDPWYDLKKRVWHTRLRKTLEREAKRRAVAGLPPGRIYYFQPHMWMQIDRDAFISYAKWCGYERRDDTIIASGYFNFIGESGCPDFDHVFIGRPPFVGIPKVTHVAYHDKSYGDAMKVMKALFPERSRFELEKSTGSTSHSDAERSATPSEAARIASALSDAKKKPAWDGILGEMSRAEGMRLSGDREWRAAWGRIFNRLSRRDGSSMTSGRHGSMGHNLSRMPASEDARNDLHMKIRGMRPRP